MRPLLLSLLVLLAFAVPAQAVTLVTSSGATAQPYQRLADRFEMPTPPIRVELVSGLPGPCQAAGFASCSQPGVIYLEHFDGNCYCNGILAHELGHQIDYSVMTDAFRSGFARIMRRSGQPWNDGGRRPLSEWFAEAFRLCASNPTGAWLDDTGRPVARDDSPESTYGYRPTVRQDRRVCALIRRAVRAASYLPSS